LWIAATIGVMQIAWDTIMAPIVEREKNRQ
jgi:hypothetical protein